MFPLQVITVGPAGASSVTFTNIPSTYTHLQIRGITQNSAGQFFEIQFNGDTGSNYAWHSLYGTGSSAASAASASQTRIAFLPVATPSSGNIFAAFVWDILDYANTNKYKTARALEGYDANGSGAVDLSSGLWQNTSAITSIKITPATAYGGTINQYSQFALYGVKSA